MRNWAVIALHNAVQGCMVVALTGSDGFGAIDPRQERRWRDAYERRAELPRDQHKLLPFLDLYAKIQQPDALQNAGDKRFEAQGRHSASMKKLNEVRNDFIHFTPKGWYLEMSGADALANDCLDVAAFLVENSGRFFIFSDFNEGELKNLIADVRRELVAWRLSTFGSADSG